MKLPPRIDGILWQVFLLTANTEQSAGVLDMAMIDNLKRISDTIWEIPVSYKQGMRVPARIYGTEKLIQELDDAVYDQVTNVATLPGITKYA
ncbi:hypothetical protein CBP16_15715, partial [Fischerella thermalis WC217]